MHKPRPFILAFFLFMLSCLLISWGYNGHYKINSESVKSFSQEMDQFTEWASTLAAHASDADERKENDPSEGPKHYIDIDNYPDFLLNGRIPQTLDSVISAYGWDFVIDQGILPWATVTAYDSLVGCFLRRDWYKAVLFASDLGHYIADGHMPLHITRNYNGQYSGNTGIHSRYESAMINTFQSQIEYPGGDVSFVDDVNGYVFSYLYANYRFVDSILLADDYAREVAGNTSSYAYKEALWNKTRSFTVPLFKNASRSLAEMIYTAWVEAGKPSMSSSGLSDEVFVRPAVLGKYHPNPAYGSTLIELFTASDSHISLRILDISGKVFTTLTDDYIERGKHVFRWEASEAAPGVYLLVLESGGGRQVMKMIVAGRR